MSVEYYEQELTIAKLQGSANKAHVLQRLINIETHKDSVNKNPLTRHLMYFEATKQALLTSLRNMK